MVISVGGVLSTFAVEDRGAGIVEGLEVFLIEERLSNGRMVALENEGFGAKQLVMTDFGGALEDEDCGVY